jgi:diguanylate cyclase (GGDEF)-like protein
LPMDEYAFRGLIEHAIGGVVLCGPDGSIQYASPAAAGILGLRGGDPVGTNLLNRIHPDDQPLVRIALTNGTGTGPELIFESIRVPGAEDDWAPVGLSARNLVGHPDVEGVVIIFRSAGEHDLRAGEDGEVAGLLFDKLTGLPNRTLLSDRMEQAILLAARNTESIAVLLLNIDRFKDVNDALGHTLGDVILGMVAQRLHVALRASDTFARLIGDEFVALLRGGDEDASLLVAGRIEAALEEPFVVNGQRIALSATMGIAVYPEHGATSDELLQHADVALRVARDRSTSFAVYRSEEDEHTTRRLALRAELREAIERNNLMQYYQPKLELTNLRVSQVEALVRWLHPVHGFVPPSEFISMAERWNTIRPLTLWALRTAIGQASGWSKAGIELGVAVNLSARDLHDMSLPNAVSDLLNAAGLEARLLVAEVTESMLMLDPDRARFVLDQLRALGVKISIDDFGTGYSSLSYLSRLPLDELKIDLSFVAGMSRSEHDRFIVAATIDLGHRLGLSVTAEGVEDQETQDLLVSMHCDSIQGYHVARPLPADELVRWLSVHQSQQSIPDPAR